jgi:hypothetical protein
MTKNAETTETPKDGEHIFNATRLTPLAIEWQKCNANGEHEKAMDLLEEIVKGSTVMFERFAQYEGFDSSVDLDTLVLAAQEKIVKWLLAWRPEKGRLFSWFSKCAKNVFKGEVVRANTYRTRIHSTGDSLEKYHGAEDHGAFQEEDEVNVKKQFLHLTTRWGSKQEIGAIRFLLESVLLEDHDKRRAILGASYAYGLSLDQSKFFYNWVLFAMRESAYGRARVPFTEQDLVRHAHSYTHIPDLLEIISWDQFKKLVMTLGGQRLKIPTSAQLSRLKENYSIYEELEASDKDPAAVEAIARRRGRTTKSAQEVWDEMSRIVRPDRSGEYEIFEEGSSSD